MTDPGGLAKELLNKRRPGILRALSSQPMEKREMKEELDIPRTTLDDIMRELKHMDLIRQDYEQQGLWRITNSGRLVAEVHERYINQLHDVCEAAELINELETTQELEPESVFGVSMFESDPQVIDGSIDRIIEKIRHGSEVRIVSPRIVIGRAADVYNAATANQGILESILPQNAVDDLRKQKPEIIADENMRLYCASIPYEFGLWIVPDDHAGMIVFTEGDIRTLVTESKEAIQWAMQRYDRVKNTAERVNAESIPNRT